MAEIRSTKGDVERDNGLIICKICNRGIMEDEDFELCPDCLTAFHKVCWQSRGGCGNPDCKSFVDKQKSNSSAVFKITSSIIESGRSCLKKRDFEKALFYYKKVLDYNSKSDEAILGIVLAESSVTTIEELGKSDADFENSQFFKLAMRVCSVSTKASLNEAMEKRRARKEEIERKAREKEEKLKQTTNELSQIIEKIDSLVQNKNDLDTKELQLKTALLDVASKKEQVESNLKKLRDEKIVLESRLLVLKNSKGTLDADPTDARLFKTAKASVGGLAITGIVSKDLTSVIVPPIINGKVVTEIGNNAFCGCSNLQSVVLPETVKVIGANAFDGCKRLACVGLHEGLKLIGNGAFFDCISLASIDIPNSVEEIGSYAFWNATGLQSVIIGSGVTTIGERTFWGCYRLEYIKIPYGVSVIGAGAFENCRALAIECELAVAPGSWAKKWNISNCFVKWGVGNKDTSATTSVKTTK